MNERSLIAQFIDSNIDEMHSEQNDNDIELNKPTIRQCLIDNIKPFKLQVINCVKENKSPEQENNNFNQFKIIYDDYINFLNDTKEKIAINNC